MSIYVMCASLPCNIVFLRNISKFFHFSFNLVQYQSFLGFHSKSLYLKDARFHCLMKFQCPFTSCIALPCNIALDTSRLFLLLIQFASIKWYHGLHRKSPIFLLSHALLQCLVPFPLEKFQGFLCFSFNLLQYQSFLGLHRKRPYLQNALFHCLTKF